MRKDKQAGRYFEVQWRTPIAVLILGAGCFVAVSAQTAGGLPAGPEREKVQKACTVCHSADNFTTKHLVMSDWNKTVVKMQGLGAEISDDDVAGIVRYLSANFGVAINVNKATEQDLIDSFSLTPNEAKAVVAYRTDHGAYASMEDLLNVRDVDARKLQSQSANILFRDSSSATGSSSPSPAMTHAN